MLEFSIFIAFHYDLIDPWLNLDDWLVEFS
jgi:hypothetical protein